MLKVNSVASRTVIGKRISSIMGRERKVSSANASNFARLVKILSKLPNRLATTTSSISANRLIAQYLTKVFAIYRERIFIV